AVFAQIAGRYRGNVAGALRTVAAIGIGTAAGIRLGAAVETDLVYLIVVRPARHGGTAALSRARIVLARVARLGTALGARVAAGAAVSGTMGDEIREWIFLTDQAR